MKRLLLSLLKPRHVAHAAGAYPDNPSRRMAWDADGSVASDSKAQNASVAGGGIGAGAFEALTAGEMINSNDEDWNSNGPSYAVSGSGTAHLIIAIIWPELRELDGAYVNIQQGNNGQWMYKSNDTTNGVDGSWVTVGAITFATTTTQDDYRDNIFSMAFATTKAVKTYIFDTGTNHNMIYKTIHLYGTISPAETPDRILFLDTENADAEFTKPLDYGDVPRGQTQTRTIKLKNNSGTKTINTIQITAEDLYLNAGSWYTFGDDDVSYQATFAVGNLGPGGTKLIYVKQVIPDAETLAVQAGRFKVSHASVT